MIILLTAFLSQYDLNDLHYESNVWLLPSVIERSQRDALGSKQFSKCYMLWKEVMPVYNVIPLYTSL